MNTPISNNNTTSPLGGKNPPHRIRWKRILIPVAVTLALAVAVITNFGTCLCGGKKNAAKLFVTDGVKDPLAQYFKDTGHYPSTAQGFNGLITQPANEPNWKGSYLADNIRQVPLDPWNHPYHYTYPGVHNPTSYDCWSEGPPKNIFGSSEIIGNW